jgi:hypothetical protein
VTKPVTKITYVAVHKPATPHPSGKGFMGAVTDFLSGTPMGQAAGSDDSSSDGTVVSDTTVSSSYGSSSGGSSSAGTVVTSNTVIIGADGNVIDISTLKAGDKLPAGATIRTGNGMVISGAGAAATTPATAAPAYPTGTPAAGAAAAPTGPTTTINGATTTVSNSAGAGGVQLVTNADGTISAIPTPLAGGSQGGAGSRTSWSGGNSTTYTSGIGPFPSQAGVINGFGVTNAGFPIVGNTPVAFLPPERAALYPSSNTTISWPCGDKPAGTEILKGVPCGVDLVAVPTAALPASEVQRLQSNIGAGGLTGSGSGTATPEAGKQLSANLAEAVGDLKRSGFMPIQGRVSPKEAAVTQTLDQKLFAYMQKVRRA